MAKQPENLVLVGFGKFDLKEAMGWIGTDKEEDLIFAPAKWPPRYRPERSCTQADLELFIEYVQWVSTLLKHIPSEGELNG